MSKIMSDAEFEKLLEKIDNLPEPESTMEANGEATDLHSLAGDETLSPEERKRGARYLRELNKRINEVVLYCADGWKP